MCPGARTPGEGSPGRATGSPERLAVAGAGGFPPSPGCTHAVDLGTAGFSNGLRFGFCLCARAGGGGVFAPLLSQLMPPSPLVSSRRR